MTNPPLSEPPTSKPPLTEQPTPEPLTCAHYVARKKRSCKLPPLKHSIYCGEHASHHAAAAVSPGTPPSHVPCPLDPAHSILHSKLSKHLKVCNANKFVYTSEPYYREDVNLPPRTDTTHSVIRQPLSVLPLQELIDACTTLAAYGAGSKVCKEEREQEVSEDDIAFYRPLSTSKGELGANALKHVVQQVALVKRFRTFHSEQTGESDTSNTCFVELGAGKGNLSQWFDYKQDGNFFVLVDRKICRQKADRYFKKEKSNFIRLKMDIKDIAVSGISEIEEYSRVCIACKHLCGGATDLALVAATQAAVLLKPTSVLIALCCHHLCTWETFTGKRHFLQHFQPQQFYTLCSLAAWATCFKMEGLVTDDTDFLSEEMDKFLTNPGQFVQNGNLVLDKTLQWYLGRCAKTVLNDGRAEFMQENGFTVQFATYVRVNVSPENTALLCFTDKSV